MKLSRAGLILLLALSVTFCKKKEDEKVTQSQQQSNNPGPQGSAVSTTTMVVSTSSTAIAGGTVTSDGGNAVTERGVCWSLNPSPTYSASSKTNDGTGTGTYTSLVSGLTPNTVYYLRAYSKNGVGISYGSQITFTTASVWTQVATVGLRGLYAKGSTLFGIEDATNIIKKSTDGGVTWNNANTGITGTPQQFIDDGPNLYVACLTGGVYVSSNDGASWTQRNNGLMSANARCFCIGVYTNVCVGTDDGMFFTGDAGQNWLFSTQQTGTVLSMASTIFSISARFVLGTTTGVIHSDDYGSTWFNNPTGISGNQVKNMTKIGNYFVCYTSTGAFISGDGGASWTSLNWLPAGQANFASKGNTGLASVDHRDLFLTKDGGITWVPINDGIAPTASNGSMLITSNYLYLSRISDGKLYRKTY